MNFKDLLPKWWSIVIWGIIALSLQGCYTQLSIFHPDPEIEPDSEYGDFMYFSEAAPRPTNLTLYAQTGAGTSLAWKSMYNRFYGMYLKSNYYNRYDYYNRYGDYYNGYDSYLLGGYRMYIPTTDRKQRTFTVNRDGGDKPTTRLKVTRTRTNQNEISNPYPVQDTPRQDTFNSQRPSSNDSGGRRDTRRN